MLRSALQDFEGTTLSAIPGLLAKLYYLARLHDGHGHYSHWGMEKVHGAEMAGRAMRTSHAGVLTEVLRTPLRKLVEDAEISAASANVPVSEFLSFLKQLTVQCLLERSTPPSRKHLTAVLHALSALVEKQERASRQGALLLPPLDR